MADYPSVPVAADSVIGALDNIQALRSENGALKTRTWFDVPKKTFQIHHYMIPTAQKELVDDFYGANRAIDFNFSMAVGGGSLTATCRFTAAPRFQPVLGDYWDVMTVFEEV